MTTLLNLLHRNTDGTVADCQQNRDWLKGMPHQVIELLNALEVQGRDELEDAKAVRIGIETTFGESQYEGMLALGRETQLRRALTGHTA